MASDKALNLYECDGQDVVEPHTVKHWSRQRTRLVNLSRRLESSIETKTRALCLNCYNAVRTATEPRHDA